MNAPFKLAFSRARVAAGAAAVAVVVGSVVAASPAFAAAGPSHAAATSAAFATSSSAATDLTPVQPLTPPEIVTPPHDQIVVPSDQTPPPGSSAERLAPQDEHSAADTASFVGTVTDRSSAQPVSGVEVVSVSVDAANHGTVEGTATTDASGHFSIVSLPVGTYYIEYIDSRDSQQPSYQWYGATRTQQGGTKFIVDAGDQELADWALVATGNVTGHVTCTTCTSAPDPATTTVYIGISDPTPTDPYNYTFVDHGAPGADGSFTSDSIWTDGNYVTFVKYTGATPLKFSQWSYSTQYAITANAVTTNDVIEALHIDSVSGIDAAVNSDVNALYYDFLTRLPNSSDVAWWGGQIQQGANPSIVSDGFVGSDEYRLIRIDAAYQSILGRPAEQAGRLNWLSAMKSGGITTDDIETSLYASQEYYLQHGNTDKGFVTSLYQTLLHRDGTDSDYTFWANLVQQHGRAWVIAQYWDSTETISERVSAMYNLYLGRTPDAAGLTNWVNVALQIGDSGLRSAFTSSDEYFIRSQYRFSEQ
ncbi:DUF4214 domain-containing protein [Subtercola sp. YIM 133946]